MIREIPFWSVARIDDLWAATALLVVGALFSWLACGRRAVTVSSFTLNTIAVVTLVASLVIFLAVRFAPSGVHQ